jgi:hypothetical protein
MQRASSSAGTCARVWQVGSQLQTTVRDVRPQVSQVITRLLGLCCQQHQRVVCRGLHRQLTPHTLFREHRALEAGEPPVLIIRKARGK